MKKLLLNVAIAGVLFLAACKSSTVNYNDTVVNLYAKYTTELQSLASNVENATDAAAKKAAIDRLSFITDSCTKVMNDLKPSDDAQKFHTSVTDLYATVKADFIPAYTKLLAIDKPEENVDAYNVVIEDVNKASQKITDLESKAMTAQREFAAKTNTRLQ